MYNSIQKEILKNNNKLLINRERWDQKKSFGVDYRESPNNSSKKIFRNKPLNIFLRNFGKLF